MALFTMVLGAPASAAAKPEPISGKLSKPGYTVIAVAANGEGIAVRATPRFKLRPPAKRVSLHLRAPNGVYAGPVVLAQSRNGRRAVVGVKAGTRLGEIEIKPRKGFATVRKTLAKTRLDPKREARARKGVPIGAGRFGLVRSQPPRNEPPGDLDADGVANPLDIDDNGNRVIDRYEPASASASVAAGRSSVARRSSVYGIVVAVNADGSVTVRGCGTDIERTGRWPAGSPTPLVGKSYLLGIEYEDVADITLLSVAGPVADGCPAVAFVPRVTPALILPLRDTVNANAAALTAADLDATLAQRGFLYIQAGADPEVPIELDCGGAPDPEGWRGGLAYCTPGGSGRVTPTPTSGTPPRSWPLAFPDCCDANGNGFGELASLVRSPPQVPCPDDCVNAFLSPGATTGQIGTGDVFNWRIRQGGTVTQLPQTLSDVFATVPALISYRDGAGNSAQVSYPVPPPYVGSDPDFLGPLEGPYQGFPVAPCPAGAPAPCVEGDIVLTLEFWRPQRAAIPGAEEGEWTDIGGLVYSPGLSGPWDSRFPMLGLPNPPNCEPSDLSTSDPRLTSAPSGSTIFYGYGFRDSAGDQPADPDNTLSFSVNLTRCIGGPLESGKNVSMWLSGGVGASASAAGNSATQEILFTAE